MIAHNLSPVERFGLRVTGRVCNLRIYRNRQEYVDQPVATGKRPFACGCQVCVLFALSEAFGKTTSVELHEIGRQGQVRR